MKFLLLMLSSTLMVFTPFVSSRAQTSEKRPELQRRRGEGRTSQRLVERVGHELRMLPYYSVFDNLEYRVSGNGVELLGQVVRPTLKSDAEGVVKRIEGVERVINHIEVLPLSPNDDRIRVACYRAVFSTPSLQRYAAPPVPTIHMIVKNGNITLVGVVDSDSDRNVAKLKASTVAGAFSVTNKLRVEREGKNT